MAKKATLPSIKETAFDCPHCGAYTTQYWFRIYAKKLGEEEPLPRFPYKEFVERVKGDEDMPEKAKEHWLIWHKKMTAGFVFLEERSDTYPDSDVQNLYISKCYHCKKIVVWVHDNIVFPPEKQGVQPNQDLHEDIVKDFEEARSIVGLSPRGAAALLRLCVHKLCVQLGEKGDKINDDIGSLVSQGLNPREILVL